MTPRWKQFGRRIQPWLTQLVALILLGLVFFLGVRSERTGFIREVVDPGIRKLRDPVLNAFRAKPPVVAALHIELDSLSFDSLNRSAERAIDDHELALHGSATFSAILRHEGNGIPIVIGLREGLAAPGAFRMWPLHVRALPGDTVLGMQTFDVLPIIDDAPLWSMLLHAALKDQGNSSLESSVAEVDLNGKALGLCVLHGRPDRNMLAQWSRGNGPVLRFDDGLMLNTRTTMAERIFPSQAPEQADWKAAPLLLQTVEGDVLSGRAKNAIKHMEAFRNGQVTASQVFDAEHVARLLATCELLGTRSALDWWNLRFLVDSVSEELVPIPLHVVAHAPIRALMADRLDTAPSTSNTGSGIADLFLQDPIIFSAYLAYLDTLSATGWWQAQLARTKPIWEPMRKVVNAEFPSIDLDTLILVHDRTIIDQALHPRTMALAYILDAQKAPDGIAVANVHSLPVEVVGVTWSTGEVDRFNTPVRLPTRHQDKPLAYVIIPLSEQESNKRPVSINVRIVSAVDELVEPVRTWSTFGAN